MPVTFRAEELLGKTLGPCRLERVLGRGGMGVVYKAHHLRLEKPVAVKVLAGPGDSARLLQEARLAARLEDPRIVSVHDAGQEAGLSYIIMQLVGGETLEQRVRRAGALAPREALRVMKEVLLGLRAAHALGIVHRDIKPANIMLEPEGGVKIMDFGVSAALCAEGGEGPESAGSWDFMPAEQGFGAAPHPTMDLYSFGATYFYALTGAPPYGATTASEQMVLHRDAPVPDVRGKRPEVTAKAAALLMRLMQKDPQARPASADEILRELNSHGMLLEVDASGSPFVLLPPPVAVQEGFIPPPSLAEAPPTPPPGAPVPSSPIAASAEAAPPKRLPAWFACLAALAALLGAWKRAGPLDWAAAAGIAALAAGSFIWSERRDLWRRLAGTACWGAQAGCLFLYARSGGLYFSLEAVILAALGVIMGAAALSLGAWANQHADRWPATGLLAASMATMLAAALSAGKEGLSGAAARLAMEARLFFELGGPWRWGGLLLLWGLWLSLKPRSPQPGFRPPPPKVVNWNK